MFLFFSKLLPLFIYPLGLSCLLLLLTLVLILQKRSRLALIPVTLTFLILLLSSSPWVSDAIVKTLEYQYITEGELPTADAIVVLGGSTGAALPPRPWIEVQEEGDRVLYAAKLYREKRAPRLILSGGRIDWRSNPGSEAEDMAILMEPMGVPRSAMLLESRSLNTRENAVNTLEIMKANKIEKILLVTSAMHMPRSMLIFKKLGIDAIPAPTDYTLVQAEQASKSTLEARILDSLPDADQIRRTTRVLKEYVGILVYRVRGWA
ncbi:YdcF family protein [Cyanobacteria bacterium FACHB-DQ100]|uniref:YdcF family protein n=1 Tax=unclassified Leptolyngbya TaxID=2650499 RepID=UPI001680608E|nr:YdcF family protein [Leptolyngbya sp. FACHB-17]MBD1825130.1 YdcF family protein [Cyanobacteria bacterium FACHB-DQ100]MBD2082517.1 YdcF family protein [Leptolyngbya sp. FACHB-17]